MADDSVQQVVSAAVSSSVNPHPSMVQPRRGRKRGQEGDDGKERGQGEKKPPEDSDKLRDTVTLTSLGQEEDGAAGFGYDDRSGQTSVTKNAGQDKEKGKAGESKKIDIRI